MRCAVVALALALVAGCTDSPERTEPDAVTVAGLDYAYRVDTAVRPGVTRITFVNEGADFHMLGLRRLADGKTFRDLDVALLNDDPADDETVFADETVDGAPNVLSPGASVTTYAELRPGTYGLVCYFPAPDGKAHYTKGMLASIGVLGEPSGAAAPDAGGEIVTTDTALTLPPLGSGGGTFRYVNRGRHPHGITFARLHDGKGYADLVTWLDAYFQGQASFAERPADIWGGLEQVRTSAYLTLDLPPGRYLAIDTESVTGQAGTEFFRDEHGALRAEFTVT